MKKQIVFFLVLLNTSLLANAQNEYRISKATGNLKLFLKEVIVEGYDGKEIIFSGQSVEKEEVDERAKGLMPISSSGFTDNTGLGIGVTVNGDEVNVHVASKKPIGQLTIKVPYNMKVSIIDSFGLVYATENKEVKGLTIKNLRSELEVSTQRSKIRLENNTGPMNVKTVYGGIEAVFDGEIKGPISIISVYDFVDITLPTATKANIELGTNYGKIYAGREFNIDLDQVGAEKPRTIIQGTGTSGGSNTLTIKKIGESANGIYTTTTDNQPFEFSFTSGERIKGKLNGGGVNLIFKSSNKNVYLRKK